jgi:phosphotransferase system IIB component
MEMGTLNGIIGDSFDTFEGAASAAGKLNAVLGGDYLNSVEMLNATESERIVLLKESFDASGKNFDQLSKYEKKAIAAAIGISDLNEANKLFSSSTSQLRMDMMQQEATQDQLAKTQAAAADVSKQMSAAFDSLAIAMAPLANIFKSVIEAAVKINDVLGGFPMKLIIAAVAFKQGAVAINMLKTAWAALEATTTRSKIGIAIAVVAIALMALHDALLVPNSPILYTALIALPFIILAIGEAADASEKGLLALGASALMVGVGVFLAAEGLAALVASFNGLGDAAPIAAAALGIFLVAFVIMVVIMAKMAPVTSIAALGVLALGGAVLMLGGGIALAALGMAELVKSIGALAKSLGPEAVKSLLAISASVLMLASAATLMLIGAFGIRALSGAIGSIRDAIAGEGTSENIKAFGDSMIGLSQILAFEGIEDSASKVVNAIRMIAEEIASITEGDNVVKFGTAMTSLNNVLTTAKTVTEEELKPAKGFIETARQYYVAQAASKDTDKDALVAAIKELKNVFAAKETAGGTDQPMKVRLVVGADEFEAKMFGLNSNTANIIR